jgi:hypothetical protein
MGVEKGGKKNNREGEYDQNTLYAYMEKNQFDTFVQAMS